MSKTKTPTIVSRPVVLGMALLLLTAIFFATYYFLSERSFKGETTDSDLNLEIDERTGTVNSEAESVLSTHSEEYELYGLVYQ